MNRTRPKQIVIRVSEEELAQIKEKVEQSGKSQQQYIIEALTQSNIVNLDGLKEIYPELKRQGNNLNQIAKKLNENGYVDYKQELPNTMKEVREVWQLLKQYLQKQASAGIGSLRDEVRESTVQEVKKALQANIEAVQKATKALEKQSDTLTSVMKQKVRELEESKNSFFRYEGLKIYLFWGGMVCNIGTFLIVLYYLFVK